MQATDELRDGPELIAYSKGEIVCIRNCILMLLTYVGVKKKLDRRILSVQLNFRTATSF